VLLKRTPGLKAALVAGLLVYGLLFVLTILPPSQETQAQAAAYFTPDEIEQGLRYAQQRRLFFWASTALQLLFLGGVVFTGFARKLADFCDRLLPGPRLAAGVRRLGNLANPEAIQAAGIPLRTTDAAEPGRWRRFAALLHWLGVVLLVGAFCFVAAELLVLPVRLARLENARAWGMTDRSLGSWLRDYVVSLGVTAVIGAVLLVGLYALIRWLPRGWWAVGAGATVLLGFFFAFILPEVINPLFNTFTPLRDPYLQRRVRALAARAGVPVETVLVMDASRQGKHTNAYFTGFGSTRRIVLYDTMLRPLHTPSPEAAAGVIGQLGSPGGMGAPSAAAAVVAQRQAAADEIESILAHEIGHWQHDHILKGISLGGLGAFAGLFLVSVVLRWAVHRAPFALRGPWDPAGLPLLLLLGVVGAWVAMPVENLVSRHFERQADAAALELADHPQAFIAGEKRMARDNISNVAPSPLSVWLFASHPTVVERIQMAEEWRRKTNK
jgi:STE24 endopeptidase